MSEPVTRAYSLDELQWAALDFMRNEYGLPPRDDPAARDAWHQRLGTLTVFVHALWNRPVSAGASQDG